MTEQIKALREVCEDFTLPPGAERKVKQVLSDLQSRFSDTVLSSELPLALERLERAVRESKERGDHPGDMEGTDVAGVVISWGFAEKALTLYRELLSEGL